MKGSLPKIFYKKHCHHFILNLDGLRHDELLIVFKGFELVNIEGQTQD